MPTLNPADLEVLKQQLLRLQAKFNQQLIIGEDASKLVILDQTSVGRISRMDAMQQQSMALSTRGKIISRLQQVEAALRTMDKGEYGYCRGCDETIAIPRLLAQPEAALCIRCQDTADRQQ